MKFAQTLLALQARRSVILSTILLCLASAVTASLLFEKSYLANATLVLPPADLIATQVEIMSSKTVAQKVVDDLRLADIPMLQHEFQIAAGGGNLRGWIAERLLGNLQVVSVRDSRVVHIKFSATSPDEAAALANAFTRAYLQTADELEATPRGIEARPDSNLRSLEPGPATDADAVSGPREIAALPVARSGAVLLTPAYPPADSTALPLWVVSLLSILCGTIFGAVFAAVAEHRDRHVRSEIDLLNLESAPFLGALGPLRSPNASSDKCQASRRFLGNWPWKI